MVNVVIVVDCNCVVLLLLLSQCLMIPMVNY
jgi:hypothetical protein